MTSIKILIISSLLLSAACQSTQNKNEITANSQKLASDTVANSAMTDSTIIYKEAEFPIINKYWKLKILEGKAVTMAKNQEREQFFTLTSVGAIRGFSGCNTFNGQFELSADNRIRIDENLAVTMMACPDVAVSESDFLEVFKLTDNYTINKDTLRLNIGRRAPLAVFEAVYF